MFTLKVLLKTGYSEVAGYEWIELSRYNARNMAEVVGLDLVNRWKTAVLDFQVTRIDNATEQTLLPL
jgi:hypothetical protein